MASTGHPRPAAHHFSAQTTLQERLMPVADVFKTIKENEVKFVDLRFTDTKGKEQHVSVPVKAFGEDKFKDGHAFDGSSIAGWKGIEASDMLLMPDPDSGRMDPFSDDPPLARPSAARGPMTGKGYERNPRQTGQNEIGTKFNSLVKRDDWMQILKYTIWNVARSYGKTATFMPKPVVGDNGSGMHVHQSVWKGGQNLFAGDQYAGLSDFALYYIGGIIKHAKALNAITNPGTNSYKRLVPGFEAPINLAYSARNRSAACRIPFVASPKSRRVEVRFPVPTANPYLAFTAMLMAGLDGVQNKMHPGDPLDKNLYDLEPEEAAKGPHPCASLEEALESLDQDREFLTRGGVFSNDMLDAYIALKMDEVTRFRMTTHPVEFEMYYSA